MPVVPEEYKLEVISAFELSGEKFDFPIWDINAKSIKDINGHQISVPDFITSANSGQVLIITIDDKQIACEVRKQFSALNYKVFHGLKEFVSSI